MIPFLDKNAKFVSSVYLLSYHNLAIADFFLVHSSTRFTDASA